TPSLIAISRTCRLLQWLPEASNVPRMGTVKPCDRHPHPRLFFGSTYRVLACTDPMGAGQPGYRPPIGVTNHHDCHFATDRSFAREHVGNLCCMCPRWMAAQQPVAKPDFPESVAAADDVFMYKHGCVPSRPAASIFVSWTHFGAPI